MKNNDKKNTEPSNDSSFPLFFKKPAVIDVDRHESAGIKPSSNFGFARNTNSLPLNAIEFALAAKHYPIVFTADEQPSAVAIMGLEKNNYFVDAKGSWKAETYIPSYVRKYPFAFVEITEVDKLALCVDEDAEHFVAKSDGKTSTKLFEAKKATALAENALEFCAAFHKHFLFTKEFCEGLKKEGLLTPNQSEATLVNGRKLNLGGFQLIDEKKFNELPDQKLLEFRKKGWLPLVYFSFLSQSNWGSLVELAGTQEKAA